jgi:Dolichyl-phosphate-mannose-protein mannosyltransferase
VDPCHQFAVLRSIQSPLYLAVRSFAKSVALIIALGNLCIICILCCLAIAFGTRMLNWLGISSGAGAEDAMYALGFFFATLQALLFILALFGWLRQSVVLVVLGGAALLAGKAWLQVGRLGMMLVKAAQRATQSRITLAIMVLITGCVVVDALLAMAPLTGSDAMFYHFTVPLLELGKRSEPMFSLAMSFYTGLGHSMIQLGMTLGSDRISTGLIYLAGVLTAGSLFLLTRKLASEPWAWIAVLTFLVTPMVYWQMSTSGCPDMWMAFYVTLAVLTVARAVETGRRHWWLLAGFFAGATAGVKYTAWIVPATVILYCIVATRSLRQSAACGACSLVAGTLPLIRNAWWSGDPFFPFLTRWISPWRFNAYSLNAILDDLHPIDSSRSFFGLVKYPFLFPLKWNAYSGFGHYWGPIVLAFAPLLIFALRRNPLASVTAVLWATVLLSNELTAQQPRYLLSVFPPALALVFAGAEEASRRGWRLGRLAIVSSIAIFLAFGSGSEAVYAKDFLPVVVGLEKREVFLVRMAPDYPAVAFINNALGGSEGKLMIFFRFGYYLRVPFESGDPRVSWLMNPDRLSEANSLLQFLCHENIRWVVKAPKYPEPLVSSFQVLEERGELRPVTSTDVSSFSNFRMYGQRAQTKLVILEVVPDSRNQFTAIH